ncbi:MAG TPA: virulence factor [Actinomycetes bacterium]|nr:virulence factor [Actinomycetes bacterium]
MAEYQIMSWRELPSMVTARQGDDVSKVQLHQRLQEAIDEAAMRLGASGSDDYLAGWTRSEWIPGEGDPAVLAHAVGHELEDKWSAEKIAEYLDSLTQ